MVREAKLIYFMRRLLQERFYSEERVLWGTMYWERSCQEGRAAAASPSWVRKERGSWGKKYPR